MSETLSELAKEMGDAGYCNYAACEEFLHKACEAGRLQGLEEAGKINSALLEALERICAQAESWHKETGHADDDPIVQCDGICACIPQMKSAIELAKAAAIREKANG